jgi:anti-anti-sigma factor
MTRTRFCDSSGIRSLLAASDTAAASHAELRLVVAGPAVLRALQVMGVDRMLALYPSMGAALTGRLP